MIVKVKLSMLIENLQNNVKSKRTLDSRLSKLCEDQTGVTLDIIRNARSYKLNENKKKNGDESFPHCDSSPFFDFYKKLLYNKRKK